MYPSQVAVILEHVENDHLQKVILQYVHLPNKKVSNQINIKLVIMHSSASESVHQIIHEDISAIKTLLCGLKLPPDKSKDNGELYADTMKSGPVFACKAPQGKLKLSFLKNFNSKRSIQ